MKTLRTVHGLLFAVLLLIIPSTYASAQDATPPAPPEPPAATDKPAAPAPEIPIRRHRMGRDSETRARAESALTERRDALARQIEELKKHMAEHLDSSDTAEIRARELELRSLEEKLKLLESGIVVEVLDSLEIPEIEIPDLGGARVIVTPRGRTIINMQHDARPWQKKHGSKLSIFEPLYIDENDWVDGAAVAIFDHVHVGGHVNEDAVSIGGNVYVTGTVAGNVVAPFGEVYLSENSVIEGDVVAIELFDEGGVIGGRIEDVSLPRMPWAGSGVESFYALLVTLALSLVVLAILLGLLTQAVAPTNVERIEDRLRTRPVGAFLTGLLAQVMAFPVWLLLVVTVIGIPVALLAMPLVLLAAQLLGFAAISIILGRSLLDRERTGRPRWLLFLTGAVLMHLPLLLGLGAHTGPPEAGAGAVRVVANLLLFVGVSVLYLATTLGIGAAVLSRLGARPRPKKNHKHDTAATSMMPPPPRADGLAGTAGTSSDAT